MLLRILAAHNERYMSSQYDEADSQPELTRFAIPSKVVNVLCRFSFTCRKRAWGRTFIPFPLAVEAQSCRGRPTIFASFLAKFVSVALSLSGFAVGFA
jgi:hypothetical protein